MSRTFAWVGLGRIVEHHLGAFAAAPDLGVPVAGCDIDPDARRRFDGRVTTYASLEEMLDQAGAAVLIVSTPTPTHAEICRRAIVHGGAKTVLVEKPLATNLSEVEELLDAAVAAGVDLRCIYHAAFGPEVDWALENLGDEIRDVTSIESEFVDPYADVEAAATYGDSWLDSGINALSIVARLVSIQGGSVAPVPSLDHSFVGTFSATSAAGEVRVRIITSWQAAEPSKVTRLDLRDGRLLVLNHQAMAARYSADDGSVLAWVSASTLPRLTQHYVAAFTHELLGGQCEDRDLLLHALLL